MTSPSYDIRLIKRSFSFLLTAGVIDNPMKIFEPVLYGKGSLKDKEHKIEKDVLQTVSRIEELLKGKDLVLMQTELKALSNIEEFWFSAKEEYWPHLYLLWRYISELFVNSRNSFGHFEYVSKDSGVKLEFTDLFKFVEDSKVWYRFLLEIFPQKSFQIKRVHVDDVKGEIFQHNIAHIQPVYKDGELHQLLIVRRVG